MKKLFLLYILFLVGCTSIELKNQIIVSILPQKYIVQRIVGKKFSIQVLIPAGYNPVTHKLTSRQMKAISHAKIYFRIGHIPFEKTSIKRICSLNPRMKVIDTSKGVKLIRGHQCSEHDHDHGHKCEHEEAESGEGIDPHIWLSPKAMLIQAKHVLKTVVQLDPKNKEFYQKNYKSLVQDIQNLENKIRNILQGAKQKKIMVFHPAWGYFARDYQLEQIALEVEGKKPSAADFKRIIDRAKRENIKVLFLQRQFDQKHAKTLVNNFGGQVVYLDPLAENWLENMEKIARTFKKVLDK